VERLLIPRMVIRAGEFRDLAAPGTAQAGPRRKHGLM